MLKKIAITLAIVALVGIVLVAIITVGLPNLGDAFTCALQNFMKGMDVTSCADKIKITF